MASIFGLTNKSGSIDAMAEALRHWSPDREGKFEDDFVVLGTLELYKTKECSLTPQPLIYKDLIVVADCRIDNREDLAKELHISDINQQSDINFIALSFEKWGKKCVDHLAGDFAFAIWNKSDQSLFIARDHFGVRPIYYSISDEGIIFASEMKGILAHEGYQKIINEAYIVSNFSALQIPDQDTFYENIKLLEAGTFLIWTKGNTNVERYWELGLRKVEIPNTVEEQEQEFNRLVVQSVQTRLRSYGNVGGEVSGGLDSTGIAATAMQVLGEGHPFYSYCYGKAADSVNKLDRKDDSHIVAQLAERYKIKEYLNILDEENIDVDAVKDVSLNLYDDIEANGVPTLSLSFLEHARKNNVRALFSGWAGDQMVTNTCGGFPEPLAYERRYRELWRDVRRRHSLLKASAQFFYVAFKCRRKNGFYLLNLENSRKKLNKSFLRPEIIEKYNLKNIPGLRYYLKRCTNIRQYHKTNLCHMGIQKRTIDHVLLGKHFKVDYRFPMLDLRLVEYINSLPFDTISPKGKTRHLYKKYAKSIIPSEVLSIHKSTVGTVPFAFAFNKKYNTLLHKDLDGIWNEELNEIIDLKDFLEEVVDEMEKRKGLSALSFIINKMM